ncbi:creatininase family protein [Wenzhouxiangella sp. XN79A]|uniref:creatininase family protein n=1 Tax=Wenzhouxiangella sp. XN79A TaxID=2724193 RepID=UPI00144A9D36|nr:creatininase family protein [Wenzhouxiangella sp. XN79A]NKI33667.1 creatininase family protein [Wenzhouxiangella sp. XN79A]
MKLQLSTWPDIQNYLERSDAILVPIGSTEQHGPTGLIGTDALCPQRIAEGMADEGVLVAPTLSIGMAQHHLGFPGSIALRPSTLIAVIDDVVSSLAATGFRRILFLNGHGGNIATVQAAFSEIWARSSHAGAVSPLSLKLVNWFTLPGVRALSRELYGSAEGSHATPSEISLTWFAHPEAQRQARLEPRIAPDGPIRDAADFRRRYSDGRCGSDPTLACVEHGQRFFETALNDLRDVWSDFTA